MKLFKFSQLFGCNVINIIYRFIISNYDITDEDFVLMTFSNNNETVKFMI